MGRRKAPVTREKTLEGHVWDAWGMARSMARGGRMTWKPLTKNSYETVSFGVDFEGDGCCGTYCKEH